MLQARAALTPAGSRTARGAAAPLLNVYVIFITRETTCVRSLTTYRAPSTQNAALRCSLSLDTCDAPVVLTRQSISVFALCSDRAMRVLGTG